MKNIAEKANFDYQAIQHFMSNSPWKSDDIYESIIDLMVQKEELNNSRVFVIDDSGNKKHSNKTVGVSRQYMGRYGKVDISQNTVTIAYANIEKRIWNWILGDLYLPKDWFEEHYENEEDKAVLREVRKKFGISDKTFKTKIEIAMDLIETLEKKVNIELLNFDGGYGKDGNFRNKIHKKNIKYMADISSNTNIYLEKPEIETRVDEKGKEKYKIIGKSYKSNSFSNKLDFTKIKVRATDRGYLYLKIARKRVFIVYDGEAREEWLVIIKESAKRHRYTLSNLEADTKIEKLAHYKAYRYFVERANQDAKSEFGWAEFRGQKYLSWSHNLAMTILASWFVSYVKLYLQNDLEKENLEEEFLLLFSVSNIKKLLLSILPFEEITPQKAVEKVIENLFNRNNSRKSRLKNE